MVCRQGDCARMADETENVITDIYDMAGYNPYLIFAHVISR